MFAATSPSEGGARDGLAGIAFAAGEGATQLAALDQRAPLRVLFPRAATGDIPLAAIVNTGGGMLAGDWLRVTVTAGPGATALVMPQAAEKVYRSEGAESRVETALHVKAGAWLEWLPQETILFQDARFHRTTEVSYAGDARLLAGEMIVLGRVARGERTNRGLVHDGWRVRRDGRLIWADALHLEGAFGTALARPSGFGGATAIATVLYAARDVDARLAEARHLLAEGDGVGVRAGASSVGGLLVARWLAAEPLALRHAFGRFWAAFRHSVAGLPARLPALWHV